MYDISPHLKLLDDVLREETRKERRNLLISNAVGIAIVKAGLVPKQVSAFGVTSDVNERGLLMVLTGVTVYFLVAFLVYAYSDLVAHRYALKHAIAKRMDEFNEKNEVYKFREMEDGKAIMPTYIPRTPEYEKLFALQAKERELTKSYNSKEVEELALNRGSILMHLKNMEYRAERLFIPLSGKAKAQDKIRLDELRAELKDLDRMLAARGAQELMHVQDESTTLNAGIANANNRQVARYYEETGLDFDTYFRFIPASLLRLFVDFVIPIGTGIYAIICMLRGH